MSAADPQQQIAFVALGGNVGSPPQIMARFRDALNLLRDVPGVTVLGKSSVFRSAAWGKTDQPDFLNAVIKLRTGLSARELLGELKQIEQASGRKPRERWGPREIDLDIVLFGATELREEGLTVPHAGLLQRAFVVVPLLEIEPDARMPDGRAVAIAARETGLQFEDAASLVQKLEEEW